MADKLQKKEAKETKAKSAKVSPKLAKLIEEIEKLSALELADLAKALEKKFGVSAAPMAAPAAPATAPTAEGGQAPAEAGQAEKTKMNVVLASAGTNKIAVIKAVREVNQAFGLKEAKDLVEAAPKEVLTDVGKEEAEAAKKKLEQAGATVELK